MKQNPKNKRGDAERAGVHYAHYIGCVITRRAIKTQFQSVDFFASDVVGKRKDGSHVYLQITAGMASAVSTRKRKLEDIPWHYTDEVYLLQLYSEPNPDNKRSKLWFFQVYEFGFIEEEELSVCCGASKAHPDIDICQNCKEHADFEPYISEYRSWDKWVKPVPVPKEWFNAYKEGDNG